MDHKPAIGSSFLSAHGNPSQRFSGFHRRLSPTVSGRLSTPLIALVCALASLILYVRTAAPSVATLFDDSLEFQVVAPTLGIAHPSGYPLYTLLGKLATLLLPWRDPAGRLNLLSAMAAAATIGVLFLVAQRLSRSRSAALVCTVAFALSPAWWSQATIAEVYALHGLFLVLLLYLLLRWEAALSADKLEPAMGGALKAQVGRRPDPGALWLSLIGLTFGLGLAHHRLIVLWFPAPLVFLAWTDPTLLGRPRRWVRPIVLGLAPLLFYLYLPLRGKAVGSLDGTFQATLSGLLDWILAQGYSVFLTGNPFGVQRSAATFAGLFQAQYGVLFLLAALFGLAAGWRSGPRRYLLLLLATVAQVVFGVAYRVQDIDVFFIPAFLLAAVWGAVGLTFIFDRGAILLVGLARRLRIVSVARIWVAGAWIVLISALVLYQPVASAVRTFPEQDRSRAWGVYDYGQDMLDHLAPAGRVVGLLGETTLLRYFRDVLGQRPDIDVVPADDEAARFTAVDRALAEGRPVYLTRDLPGAAERYSLDAAGPLIAVSPKAPPAPIVDGELLGEHVLLQDAQTVLRQTHAGPVVRLTLTWAASESVTENLKVSARLLDSNDRIVAIDDRVPVHFTYPPRAWSPGELVTDIYDLAPSPDAPAGPYHVLIILYRAADGSEVGRATLPAQSFEFAAGHSERPSP